MKYRNLTTLTDDEYVERMITSYSQEARFYADRGNEFLAGWYARQCVSIDRKRFKQRCSAIVDEVFSAAGLVRVA